MSHLGTFESLSSLSRSLPPVLAPQRSWEPRSPSSSALGWSRRRGTECCLVTLRRHLQLIFRSTQPCTPAVCRRSPLCSPVVWSPPQYMEIVAHGYLGYGEAQHSVDKLVNMTCERGPGGSAGEGGRFEHSGGSPHSYGLESPCQLLCSVAKRTQRGDFRSWFLSWKAQFHVQRVSLSTSLGLFSMWETSIKVSEMKVAQSCPTLCDVMD